MRRLTRFVLLTDHRLRWALIRHDTDGNQRMGLGGYALCIAFAALMLGFGWRALALLSI